jgi:hypothetical protein
MTVVLPPRWNAIAQLAFPENLVNVNDFILSYTAGRKMLEKFYENN